MDSPIIMVDIAGKIPVTPHIVSGVWDIAYSLV
jgi:hypothetical protein